MLKVVQIKMITAINNNTFYSPYPTYIVYAQRADVSTAICQVFVVLRDVVGGVFLIVCSDTKYAV